MRCCTRKLLRIMRSFFRCSAQNKTGLPRARRRRQSVSQPCHCEGRQARGNPSPNPVIARSEATRQSRGNIVHLKFPVRCCLEIATAPLGPRNDRCGRWSAHGPRFPLSLRGPSGPRQSRGSIIHLKFPVRCCPEIATAPLGPRNDGCGRWSAPGLRFPLSLRGAKRRGPQGSAACGGVKRPQRLGRHLPLHKRSAGQRLSANPEIRSFGSPFLWVLPARGTDCRGFFKASQ